VDGPGGPLSWRDLPPDELEKLIAALRAEGREYQAEAAHALRLAEQLEARLAALQQADRQNGQR